MLVFARFSEVVQFQFPSGSHFQRFFRAVFGQDFMLNSYLNGLLKTNGCFIYFKCISHTAKFSFVRLNVI
jgi:hypothetical protein